VSNRTPSPTVAHHRGRVAGYSRSRAADDPDYLSAQADLAAAKLAEYVAKVVNLAPPLNATQRETVLAAFVGIRAGDAA
jgi:hypothetical protein